MEVIDFSIDNIGEYSMWFMLNKIKEGPIDLVYRTPAGDEQFGLNNINKYAFFKMKNGKILLGINNYVFIKSKHNLFAISNNEEEIVNLQMFENIMDNYNASVNHTDKGYFIFTDSIVIAPELKLDWRCDNTRYGPMNYAVSEGIQEVLTVSLDQLIAYDPILSVDGIAHLVYIHFKNDAEYRYSFANELQLPICGATISEALKLISEWATVAEPPFNNQQNISKDAKEFLSKLDFDLSLVEYQTDMYVAEYIKGNKNARMRPSDVKPLSKELDLFIKKKMSYRCLSALISLHPDTWDIQEIIFEEEKYIRETYRNFYKIFAESNNQFMLNALNNNFEKTLTLYNTVKATGIF